MALEQAQLVPADAHDRMAGRRILLVLAALCGMLLLPLMFNIAFYRILRETFVLWHSALAVSLLRRCSSVPACRFTSASCR